MAAVPAGGRRWQTDGWAKRWVARHGRWAYYKAGEKPQWTPPPGHVDRFGKSDAVVDIAAFYDDATRRLALPAGPAAAAAASRKDRAGAKRHRGVDTAPTDSGATFGKNAGQGGDGSEALAKAQLVRTLMNWIKQGMMREAVHSIGNLCGADGRVHWVDLACGRGQDVRKVARVPRDVSGGKLRLGSWHAYDVSPEAVAEATVRASETFTRSGLRRSDWSATVADVAAHLLPLPHHEAHVVSVQLALHYFFESPERLHGVFSNAAHALKPGGLLIATLTSGEACVREAELSGAALHGLGSDAAPGISASIRCPDPYHRSAPETLYEFHTTDEGAAKITALCTGDAAGPDASFGISMFHRLAGDSVAAVEWMTNREALVSVAADHGLMLKRAESAAVAAYRFSLDPGMARIAFAMGVRAAYDSDAVLRVASMYDCVIFRYEGGVDT